MLRMPVLDVESHVGYGQSEVLHGLNFAVAPGEIVAVMGRNGMGKTTLMKSLIGVCPSSAGADPGRRRGRRRAARAMRGSRSGLAYVPQGRMIFSTMTVQENIETGLVVTGKPQGSAGHLRAVPGAAGDEASAAAATSPAASSSSSPSPARSPPSRRCCCSTSRPRASSPRSSRTWRRTLKRHPRRARPLHRRLRAGAELRAGHRRPRARAWRTARIVHEDARADVDEATVARFLSV